MSTVLILVIKIVLDLLNEEWFENISEGGSYHGVMCLPPHGHIVSQVFLKRNLIGLEFKCRQIYFLFLFSKKVNWEKRIEKRWQAERLKLNI